MKTITRGEFDRLVLDALKESLKYERLRYNSNTPCVLYQWWGARITITSSLGSYYVDVIEHTQRTEVERWSPVGAVEGELYSYPKHVDVEGLVMMFCSALGGKEE